MGGHARRRSRTGRSGLLSRRLEDHWDNDDVHVRPSGRSRPRSKNRPTHATADTGTVLTVDRGRYGVLIDEGQRSERTVVAMRARELGRRAVVVGDRVDVVGDTTGASDTLARIVRIGERTSEIRRSRDDQVDADSGASVGGVGAEKVLVANADRLAIVASLLDPEPRTGFIDRCLVAAYTGHLAPLLILTKSDLPGTERVLADLTEAYTALDLPVVVTHRLPDRTIDPVGLARVHEHLDGSTTVLIGHSGVGKSTLVNTLVPDAYRATGGVTGVGKGRHTSTSAVALRLPAGGWVIDTPGVRSFGLAHVTAEDLLETFDDLLDGSVDCPPGCTHVADTGCALDALVASGGTSAARLDSFRRLLASRAGTAEDRSPTED